MSVPAVLTVIDASTPHALDDHMQNVIIFYLFSFVFVSSYMHNVYYMYAVVFTFILSVAVISL